MGFHEPPYSVEFKYLESSSEVSVRGFRLYHHVVPLTRANYYWGLDLSRIRFEGDLSGGRGTSTGVFFGVHRELAPYLSWRLDIGPYFIHLQDESTGISTNNTEFTVTTGLNLELW
ncbi:MAG: hypothetical protein ABEH89_00490 [bacterium]